MITNTYNTYIKRPFYLKDNKNSKRNIWYELRIDLIRINNAICPLCNLNFQSRENLLHVHHIDHDRNNNNSSNLTLMCLKCHQKHHAEVNRYKAMILNEIKCAKLKRLINDKS
jgi:hypothetical protein